MSDKDVYLDFHGFIPGTPEAEQAWADKLAMNSGHRFMPTPMVFVSRDICYDSPIDGRPITNMQARKDDLARSGCIEYDPGMKQDHQRRLQAEEAALDRSVDEHVERSIAQMPSRKLEKLTAELQGGMDVAPVRITPEQRSGNA